MSAPFDIVRQPSTPKGTEGELLVEGIHLCWTLERPWLSNAQDISSIPVGVYEVRLLWSDHFKGLMPHVMDVPGRAGVLLHPLNTVAETKGCIGLGDWRGKHGGQVQGTDVLVDSGEAFHRFVAWFSSTGSAATVTISQAEAS